MMLVLVVCIIIFSNMASSIKHHNRIHENIIATGRNLRYRKRNDKYDEPRFGLPANSHALKILSALPKVILKREKNENLNAKLLEKSVIPFNDIENQEHFNFRGTRLNSSQLKKTLKNMIYRHKKRYLKSIMPWILANRISLPDENGSSKLAKRKHHIDVNKLTNLKKHLIPLVTTDDILIPKTGIATPDYPNYKLNSDSQYILKHEQLDDIINTAVNEVVKQIQNRNAKSNHSTENNVSEDVTINNETKLNNYTSDTKKSESLIDNSSSKNFNTNNEMKLNNNVSDTKKLKTNNEITNDVNQTKPLSYDAISKSNNTENSTARTHQVNIEQENEASNENVNYEFIDTPLPGNNINILYPDVPVHNILRNSVENNLPPDQFLESNSKKFFVTANANRISLQKDLKSPKRNPLYILPSVDGINQINENDTDNDTDQSVSSVKYITESFNSKKNLSTDKVSEEERSLLTNAFYLDPFENIDSEKLPLRNRSTMHQEDVDSEMKLVKDTGVHEVDEERMGFDSTDFYSDKATVDNDGDKIARTNQLEKKSNTSIIANKTNDTVLKKLTVDHNIEANSMMKNLQNAGSITLKSDLKSGKIINYTKENTDEALNNEIPTVEKHSNKNITLTNNSYKSLDNSTQTIEKVKLTGLEGNKSQHEIPLAGSKERIFKEVKVNKQNFHLLAKIDSLATREKVLNNLEEVLQILRNLQPLNNDKNTKDFINDTKNTENAFQNTKNTKDTLHDIEQTYGSLHKGKELEENDTDFHLKFHRNADEQNIHTEYTPNNTRERLNLTSIAQHVLVMKQAENKSNEETTDLEPSNKEDVFEIKHNNKIYKIVEIKNETCVGNDGKKQECPSAPDEVRHIITSKPDIGGKTIRVLYKTRSNVREDGTKMKQAITDINNFRFKGDDLTKETVGNQFNNISSSTESLNDGSGESRSNVDLSRHTEDDYDTYIFQVPKSNSTESKNLKQENSTENINIDNSENVNKVKENLEETLNEQVVP